MGCLSVILFAIGGLFLFYGLFVIWLPLGWFIFIFPGTAFVLLGLLVRRKRREIRMRRQMGDRW